MPFSNGLDAELLAGFEAHAREGYADLLAALTRATHPAPEAGPSARPAAEAWIAVSHLCESWFTARTLEAPAGEVQVRFPLAHPGSVGLLDNLLALAAYTGSSADHVASVGQAIHRLSAAAMTHHEASADAA